MSEQNKDPIKYDVVLREPEKLLQKLFGDELVITKLETSELSGTGDNYGSSIFKIKFLVKKCLNSKVEDEINVIAKMFPPTEMQRQIFQSSFTFKKEIFFYEVLIPCYRDIYREISEDFDIAPKLVGSRLSLKTSGSEDVDEDAVILLEDLKCKEFYMGSRIEGLDLPHLQYAVICLAKFHGIGLSVKHKRPDFYKLYESYNRTLEGIPSELIKALEPPCLRYFEESEELRPYVKNFNNTVKYYCENATSWVNCDPSSLWSCVVHGDVWLNNMMFHKNDKNIVDEVKLVDFQTYHLNSPLRDLMFFLTSSSQPDVLLENFDELVELYRVNLEKVLSGVGCDASFASKEKFLEKLKEDAKKEFTHCLWMLKPITLSKSEDLTREMADNNMIINDDFKKRMRSVMLLFARKIWS